MRHATWFLCAVAIIATSGCRATTSASDCASFAPSSPDVLCITGTVRYFTFEGGFWAVRGDDDTTYDPLGALPVQFRRQGLRVRLEARIRSDLMSFHQAGPIVEILNIQAL